MDDAPKPDMIDQIKFIVDQTQSRIILSSTWRLEEKKKNELERALLQKDLTVKGSTPDLAKTKSGDRVDEIMLWLEMRSAADQSVDAYIVIDDLNLSAMNDRLKETHFVRIDDKVGITRENAEEAVAKL